MLFSPTVHVHLGEEEGVLPCGDTGMWLQVMSLTSSPEDCSEHRQVFFSLTAWRSVLCVTKLTYLMYLLQKKSEHCQKAKLLDGYERRHTPDFRG